MAAARASGEAWVLQPGSSRPRLTRADSAARHARLRRPVEAIALVTDEACASACLDFADLVRSVPGAVHLGRTTSADTVYIDTGWHKLPSGNLLFLPLKVWRNRTRGNNEALVPDVPLALDGVNEAATRRAVLASFGRSAATGR
jgi:hypothetical protein